MAMAMATDYNARTTRLINDLSGGIWSGRGVIFFLLLPFWLSTSWARAEGRRVDFSVFPSVEEVRSKIQGTNPVDTAARQSAGFKELGRILIEIKGNDDHRSEVKALLDRYTEAMNLCTKEAYAFIDSSTPATERPSAKALFRASIDRFLFDHRAAAIWPRAEAIRKDWDREQTDKQRREARIALGDKMGKQTSPGSAGSNQEIEKVVGWALLAFSAIMLIWLFIGIRRELQPFEFRASESPSIVTGRTVHRLFTMRGIALGPGTMVYQSLHISASQSASGQSLSAQTQTDVHNEFRLASPDGEVKDFEFINRNLKIFEKDEIVVVWAVKEGLSEGPYILVHNRTTRLNYFFRDKLHKIVSPSGWLIVPSWLLLSTMLLILTSGFVAGCGLVFLPIVLAVVHSKIAGRRVERIIGQLNRLYLSNLQG